MSSVCSRKCRAKGWIEEDEVEKEAREKPEKNFFPRSSWFEFCFKRVGGIETWNYGHFIPTTH
jgi:hypothetical protein